MSNYSATASHAVLNANYERNKEKRNTHLNITTNTLSKCNQEIRPRLLLKCLYPEDTTWVKLVLYSHIYAFSRRFKATYIAFKLQFYIWPALAFPGNRTHDLGVASAMLYHLSYRKTFTTFTHFHTITF